MLSEGKGERSHLSQLRGLGRKAAKRRTELAETATQRQTLIHNEKKDGGPVLMGQ